MAGADDRLVLTGGGDMGESDEGTRDRGEEVLTGAEGAVAGDVDIAVGVLGGRPVTGV